MYLPASQRLLLALLGQQGSEPELRGPIWKRGRAGVSGSCEMATLSCTGSIFPGTRTRAQLGLSTGSYCWCLDAVIAKPRTITANYISFLVPQR